MKDVIGFYDDVIGNQHSKSGILIILRISPSTTEVQSHLRCRSKPRRFQDKKSDRLDTIRYSRMRPVLRSLDSKPASEELQEEHFKNDLLTIIGY